METLTMKNLYRALVMTTCGIMLTAVSPEKAFAQDDFEKQVEDYIQKFPYQNTYDYAMQLTGGDPREAEYMGHGVTGPAQGR